MSPVEIFGIPRSLREPFRLRALARPGGPSMIEVRSAIGSLRTSTCYARRPRIRVFFMNPS